MPKEDLELEQSSERNNKPQSEVNIEVDSVKGNVLDIINDEEKYKNIEEYCKVE
jgi:hypothetical protein